MLQRQRGYPVALGSGNTELGLLMTAIWTPSRELIVPKRPKLVRKVTDWCRMAAGAISTCGGTVNTGNGKISTNANQTGGCECGPACQAQVEITGLKFNYCYSQEYNNLLSSWANEMLLSPVANAPSSVVFMVQSPLFVGDANSSFFPITCEYDTSSSSGCPSTMANSFLNLSTPNIAFTHTYNLILGNQYQSNISILMYDAPVDSNNNLVAGTYPDVYGYGTSAIVSYPTTSPLSGVPSSISISNTPVTFCRSPSNSSGTYSVPSSSSTPAFSGTINLGTPRTCPGISGGFGYTGTSGSVSSWGGYQCAVINLYSWGSQVVSTSVDVLGASIWVLEVYLSSSVVCYYFNSSASGTGTYYASDSLTVPQALTVT